MQYVVRDREATSDMPLGGKALALAALARSGVNIPRWCAVRPAALEDSLTPGQRSVLEASHDPSAIQNAMRDVAPSANVQEELAAAVAELCGQGERVAVRSSASDEDGVEHSFAGQLDSFLFVAPADVPAKVAAVWRSGFSERIVAYRREHGLDPQPRPPAVLIQRMVDADSAGVAFGADPISGRRDITVVGAVYGVGAALVSGDCNADTYRVDTAGQITERSITEKREALAFSADAPEGLRKRQVPEELARSSVLSDSQVRQVAELVQTTSRHSGRPQDIEWAIQGSTLYLLQSRPITSLADKADPAGERNIWDNSNVAESYNGITTPLTFSFARRVYEEVYRQFCRLLRVPAHVLAANDDVFRRMLGLIRGRVYYNLLNWYRVLALLPGFAFNRRFMEQMMGVKESLPDEILAELPGTSWRGRMRDLIRLAGSMAALVGHHLRIDREVGRFYERLNAALGTGRPDLAPRRPDELAAYYRKLEQQLLTRWDAPLVNDFLAMIFYGALRKLTEKWCHDHDGTLQNDLISAEGGIISAEPAQRVRAMAELACPHPALVDTLAEGSQEEIEQAIKSAPKVDAAFQSYLAKFGDRCLEELKLESTTLHEDPLPLLRSIGHMARRLAADKAPMRAPGGLITQRDDETTVRGRAEQQVAAALRFRLLRRWIFGWVLRNARARIRDRENLRFERTRLFGRVRMIFLELGRKFHALDLLAEPRDIFYLELSEILGFIDGTATTADLAGLVAVRKAEINRYRKLASPATRFETRGAVHQGNPFTGEIPQIDQTGDRRQGLGCCAGVVRGRVRVITDPRGAVLKQGEILVAERTDPGWIMLFPAAAGLLVEHGSLLSHSAIVARELGIPAIVSIEGVTSWLQDGDWVELDGRRGVVIKIDEALANAQ